MELKSLSCPNCRASVEIEDGLDIFYCKYCGYKILLDGQSDAAYDSKVKIKYMEYQERLQKQRHAQERYRIAQKLKAKWVNLLSENAGIIIYFGVMFVIVIMLFLVFAFGKAGENKQERKLEKTVKQIMKDIDNEDFADAYVKANLLYWDDSYSDSGESKWNATRKEIMSQIKKAEKEASKKKTSSDNEEEDKGWNFFGLFD